MKPINEYIDHTLLKADATPEDIKKLCEEAKKHEFYSVCVNPFFIHYAKTLLQGTQVKVCTVVDFPLGASGIHNKSHQTNFCIRDGADEIDMVLPVGLLKAKRESEVREQISAVVKSAGDCPVKVIVETALLNDAEKERACHLVMEGGAAFIKTSTGFSTGGATVEDIKLFRSVAQDKLQIKASGGIKSYEQAKAMVEAGADRLGTSSSVEIKQQADANV